MLLFHGTRGDRTIVESIADQGLRAAGRAWTHALLGREDCAFLSNAPVAGHGGDPVAFAMGFGGWLPRRASVDGWIVVVDLPKDAHGLVRAVIPNLQLARYFERDRHFALLETNAWFLDADSPKARIGPPVVEVLAELGRRDAKAPALRPILLSKYADLHAETFSFAAWRRYAAALRVARTLDDVVRAGRRYGFTWDHPEVPHCELCVAGMATWAYEVEASPPLACADGRRLALPLHGRDPVGDGLEALARTVARWFEGVPEPVLAARFEALRAAPHACTQSSYERLVKTLAIDPARLPPAWQPGFGTQFSEEDLRAHDVQLVCDAIPRDYVVGALRIATAGRLRPWARPTRGETLLSKLWRAANTLRERSRGPATVYDG
ncbi:MAG: hypothetical protein ACXVEE_16790 [Polyangiales bacterium]